MHIYHAELRCKLELHQKALNGHV